MITTSQIFGGIAVVIVLGLFYLGFKNTSASGDSSSGSNKSSGTNNTKN